MPLVGEYFKGYYIFFPDFHTTVSREKKNIYIFSNISFTIVLIHLHQPKKLKILFIVCNLTTESFIKIKKALFLQEIKQCQY